MVHVIKSDISDRKFVSEFVRVGTEIILESPPGIARLETELKDHLSKINPYFMDSKVRLFIAYDHHRPIGRISAQITDINKETGTGHFGFLAAKDSEALRAMLEAAQNWLKSEGCSKIEGPYSLSINDEVGLLVDGADKAPRILMNYSPGWMSKAIESFGYNPAKDLLAYDLDLKAPLPETILKISNQAKETMGLEIREISRKNLKSDLKIVQNIFNKAWAENWGFIPISDADLAYMEHTLKPVLDPRLTHLAFFHGHPIAMIVALPDINEIIKDFKGKLLPFNWLRLLWRLKLKTPQNARVLLMGVVPEHQSGFKAGVSSLVIITELHATLRDKNYQSVEMSWILENNKPMRKLIERLGGEITRRYRVYEKELD